jgi:peptidoglycan L-alanyl-D-glutamate endopeptidase CwlK
MQDKITIERIKSLHPKLRDEALEIYNQICISLTGKAICRFSFTIRTFEEQSGLYAQGRTKPGKIVTQAKAGLSYHNYGLAIDVVLLVDKDKDGNYETASWDRVIDFDGDGKSDFQEIVTLFKQYGWEWGGDWNFKDYPHFQKKFGKSVRDLLALHNSKKIDKQGYVIL